MISKRIPLLQPGDNFYKDHLIRKSKSNYGHICFKEGKISISYKSYMHVTNAIDKNAIKWVE